MSNIDTVNVGGLDYSIEDTEAREQATSAITVSAYVENGNTASRAYSVVGTPINWKGSLYYTTATIAQGSTLAAGTNLASATNIGQMITNIRTYVGSDSKLHFRDATGADSVLPFNSAPTIIKLRTGITNATTIDCKSLIPNYTQATNNNFVLISQGASLYIAGGLGGDDIHSLGASIGKFYNASTGILSITGVFAGWNNNWVTVCSTLTAYYVSVPLAFT